MFMIELDVFSFKNDEIVQNFAQCKSCFNLLNIAKMIREVHLYCIENLMKFDLKTIIFGW